MAHVLKAATPENTPGADPAKVTEIVSGIIADVRSEGDAAVRRWSQKLDSWSPESFRLGPEEIRAIGATLPTTVIEDIEFVQAQVRRFAQAQLASLHEFEIETLPGVRLGQKLIPIEASGAYVPGGRYPLLASAHMSRPIRRARLTSPGPSISPNISRLTRAVSR